MSLRDAVLETAKKHFRFIRASGNDNISAPCPFHKSGEERRPSFYINLNNGLYYCHACLERGTLPQLLRRLGESSISIDTILDLIRRETQKQKRRPIDLHGKHLLHESLLGVFDFCPTSLVEAGFKKEILHKLDVGFDQQYHRITFPIRDVYGNLVGFNGRTVTNEYPRYKVYKKDDLIRFWSGDLEDEDRYRSYDIKNHHYLWNMHNVFPSLFYRTLDTVIVVEGYKACIWMLQNGYDNTVALQGARMSDVQENTLIKFSGNVIIFLDNNNAGLEGTLDTGARLLKKGQNVLVCTYSDDYDEGTQPDNLDQTDIRITLEQAQPFITWRNRQWNIRHRGNRQPDRECSDTYRTDQIE